MHATNRPEARLHDANNVLVVSSSFTDETLRRDFFGSVIDFDDHTSNRDFTGKTVYLCGDAPEAAGRVLDTAARVIPTRDNPGRVPLRVHGVGVYVRRFFDSSADHFHRIRAEHAFQSLTESTKPGTAHRTGIYLTPVEQDSEGLHFRLLRCSTNLSGPTENFGATDRRIVEALNEEAAFLFQDHAPLNHVLAQVYHNTPAADATKASKAKISAHADKTKDMPGHGIMAFCTFYDRLDKLSPHPTDPFDSGRKGVSGLTKLHFRLKEPADGLPEQFALTLYPDSVFFMPLSTNRLYTHEIRPPALDAEFLPTRLGYVVRCSSREAVHTGGHTFLKADGRLVPLEPPTPDGTAALRRLYAEENKTTAVIDYGDGFAFSMNAGDYLAPRI